MRIRLEQLATRGFTLELPQGADGQPRRLVVREADELQGSLTAEAGRLTIEDGRASRVSFDTFEMLFGAVRLSSSGLELCGLTGGYESEGEHLALDAGARSGGAVRLAVDVGSFHVEGRVSFESIALAVRNAGGHVEMGGIEIHDFRLRDENVSCVADVLSAQEFRVGWGTGLRLEAAGLSAPKLEVLGWGTELQAGEVEAKQLSWVAGNCDIGLVSVGSAQVAAPLGAKASASSSGGGESTSKQPSKDEERGAPFLSLLDGLSGQVNVDVAVDVKVPLLGSRSAVHRLRVPIDEGTLDFRELERDLSPLEDALLDFSVRDGHLVLELGVPLLPTRGLGKPLVVWELAGPDRKLAEQRRVRLSVLPNAKLASSREGEERSSDDESTSLFALERLVFDPVQARLNLHHEAAEASHLPQLALEEVVVTGRATYKPSGSPEDGYLLAKFRGLEARLHELNQAIRGLSIDAALVEGASELRVDFRGIEPQRATGALHETSVRGLRLVTPAAVRKT